MPDTGNAKDCLEFPPTTFSVFTIKKRDLTNLFDWFHSPGGRGGGVLPNMGYIGMCRCEGYGFQAVYSRIGYINQSVWV